MPTPPVRPVFIPPYMKALVDKIDAQNATINELKVKIDALTIAQAVVPTIPTE